MRRVFNNQKDFPPTKGSGLDQEVFFNNQKDFPPNKNFSKLDQEVFFNNQKDFLLPRIFKTFTTFQEVHYLLGCQEFKHHLYNIIMTETPVDLIFHAVRNHVK